MAKPLGPKSALIRTAILANPSRGNKELAEMINDSPGRLDDKIKVTADDVAQQKVRMKKPGAALPAEAATAATPVPATAPAVDGKKRGRPKGSVNAPKKKTPIARAAKPAAQRGPVELIDKVFDLADEVGGLGCF